MLVGGFARSVEAQQLLRTGWAQPLALARGVLRSRARIEVAGADEHSLDRDPLARSARLPSEAHRLVRDALAAGPVLVQTPRSGLRRRARLRQVPHPGPVRCVPGAAGDRRPPRRRPPAAGAAPRRSAWACPECGDRGLRAPVVGEARTAEELGRAFPGAVVRMSGGRPGARPGRRRARPSSSRHRGPSRWPTGGYAAVVLLDTWLTLGLDHLRADEEALRRWSNAVGLLREGGRALAVGDPAHPALQALIRWDHAGFAEREAEARREAHLPPASRLATLTGEIGAVDDVLTLLDRPEGTEVLGPVAGQGARPRRGPGGRAGAPGAGRGPLGRARRAAAAPVRPQAGPGPHPGRPAHSLGSPV